MIALLAAASGQLGKRIANRNLPLKHIMLTRAVGTQLALHGLELYYRQDELHS